MAIINCAECGAEISDRAVSCVRCGNPVATVENDLHDMAYQTPAQDTPQEPEPRVNNAFAWILAIYPLVGMLFTSGVFVYIGVIVTISLCALDASQLKKQGIDVSSLRRIYMLIYPLYLYKRAKLLGQKQTYMIAWVLALTVGFAATLIMNDPGSTTSSVSRALAKPVDMTVYQTGVTYDNLARTPETYKGERVSIKGRVSQVIEASGSNRTTQILLDVSPSGSWDTQNVYCGFIYASDSERLLENDQITVWGTSEGLITYESLLGQEITVPRIWIDWYQ